jgi:hypothetical protein
MFAIFLMQNKVKRESTNGGRWQLCKFWQEKSD